MYDDIDLDDRAYEKHMRRASAMLAKCINRARAGLPTDAPDDMADRVKAAMPARVWSPEEITAMVEMRKRGRTQGQIAMALDRTRGAVQCALARYGMEQDL